MNAAEVLMMRRVIVIVAIAACTAALCGCGGTGVLGMGGRYQPVGWGSTGYDETRLALNVFRVSYVANVYTSLSTATDLALLRSAELTLEKGFDHFAVVSGTDAVALFEQSTPVTRTESDGFAHQTRQRQVTVGQRTISAAVPSTINTIVCFKGVPRNVGFVVMDAKEIYAQITTKHQVKRKF